MNYQKIKDRLRWSQPSKSRDQTATITSELANLSQVIKPSPLDQPLLPARRHSLLSPISIGRRKSLLSPIQASSKLVPLSASPKAGKTFDKALDLMTKLFGPVPPLQPDLQRNAKPNVLLVITDSTGVVTTRTPVLRTSTLQDLLDFENQSKMFKRRGSMRALPSGNSKRMLTPAEPRSHPRRMKSISETISASLI